MDDAPRLCWWMTISKGIFVTSFTSNQLLVKTLQNQKNFFDVNQNLLVKAFKKFFAIFCYFAFCTTLILGVSTLLLGLQKMKGPCKKWLKKVKDAPRIYVGKAAEALYAAAGSFISAISTFLGNAVEFVVKDRRDLFAFIAGIIES